MLMPRRRRQPKDECVLALRSERAAVPGYDKRTVFQRQDRRAAVVLRPADYDSAAFEHALLVERSDECVIAALSSRGGMSNDPDAATSVAASEDCAIVRVSSQRSILRVSPSAVSVTATTSFGPPPRLV